jgi:simple sugar transport system permease protein
LLGRGNPFGVVAAALLFGGLRAGATKMQFNTQVPSEIIAVIQGLILLFIAAEAIIRRLYRLPSETATTTPALTSGWGKK